MTPAAASQAPTDTRRSRAVGRLLLVAWLTLTSNVTLRIRQRISGVRFPAALRQTRFVSRLLIPEGTTSRGPGILPFRHGAFRLVAGRNIPVVPVAIEYAERSDAWVDDDDLLTHFLERFARPRLRARVIFGPELRGDDPAALCLAAERWIAGALSAPLETGAVATANFTSPSGDGREAVTARELPSTA